LQISDKNVIEPQKTIRSFFIVLGKPTDEGIAIICFRYIAATNDGGFDDSGSIMNYHKPNPRYGQEQRRDKNIGVRHNA
jgi:hypothetical protein